MSRGSKILTRRNSALVFCSAILIVFVFLWHSSVDNSISTDDEKYIQLLLQSKEITALLDVSFDQEIAIIQAVQNAILYATPGNTGIPPAQTREPKDVYKLRQGLCYDRSRAIEKSLRYLGFDTRHIFLFEVDRPSRYSLEIFSRSLKSHAITEVKTSRGWLVVDSNFRWISLGKNNQPVSIEQIRKAARLHNLQFATPVPLDIYQQPFSYLFGLYSRHGLFYPPFNSIPDIHYEELLENIP